MLDQRLMEPNIELFHPLLIHFSSSAAILYGYLKHLVIAKDLPINGIGEESCYDIHTTRNEIKEETGLSFGEQIDAELELCFANLAISCEIKDDVGFDLYPQNEAPFRRAFYRKQMKWTI